MKEGARQREGRKGEEPGEDGEPSAARREGQCSEQRRLHHETAYDSWSVCVNVMCLYGGNPPPIYDPDGT